MNILTTIKQSNQMMGKTGRIYFNMLVLFIFYVFAMPLQAGEKEEKGPSFDCAKATTVQEKLICKSESLAALDLELSELYSIILRKWAGMKKFQRKWLKSRNQLTTVQDIEQSYRDQLKVLRKVDSNTFHPTNKIEFEEECEEAGATSKLIVRQRWHRLKKRIKWPLSRRYPLSNVTYQEFIQNPKILFDDWMLFQIANTDKIQTVGWRGCMVANGLFWFRRDEYDGQLFLLHPETEVSFLERQKLSKAMIQKLPVEFQTYWPSRGCDTKDGSYQIFSDEKDEHHMFRIQYKDRKPIYCDKGTMTVGGSLRVTHYTFQCSTGKAYFKDNAKSGVEYNVSFLLDGKEIKETCDR